MNGSLQPAFPYDSSNTGGRYGLARERIVHADKLRRMRSVVDTKAPDIWVQFNKFKACLPNKHIVAFQDNIRNSEMAAKDPQLAKSFGVQKTLVRPSTPSATSPGIKNLKFKNKPYRSISRPSSSPQRSPSPGGGLNDSMRSAESPSRRPKTAGSKRNKGSRSSTPVGARPASAIPITSEWGDESGYSPQPGQEYPDISGYSPPSEQQQHVQQQRPEPSYSSKKQNRSGAQQAEGRIQAWGFSPEEEQICERFIGLMGQLNRDAALDLVEDVLKEATDRRYLSTM